MTVNSNKLDFIPVWVLFFFSGITDVLIIGRENFPAWSVFLSFMVCCLFFLGKLIIRWEFISILYLFLFVALIPSAYEGLSGSMVVALSIPLCFLLASRKGRSWTFSEGEEKFIFYLGGLTAMISLLLFGYFSLVDRPVFGLDLERPGYGYSIDRGVLLRLVGFADDPNFFSVAASLSLFIGLSRSNFKCRNFFLMLIAISMFFTFSRSGLLAIMVGLVFAFRNRISPRYFWTLLTLFIVSLVGYFLYGSIVSLLNLSAESVVDRSIEGGFLSRFNLIGMILTRSSLEFFGNGIGSAKALLGIHSHNTFFDFLFEGGYIPGFIYLAICSVFVFKAWLKPSLMSGFGVEVIASSAVLSIGYQPILVLTLMMAGRYRDLDTERSAHVK